MLLWLIYILILLITLLFYSNSLNVFYSTLIAAIIVFIALAWVDFSLTSDSENLWIMCLVLIAFILPLIIIIYLISEDNLKLYNKC